MTEVKRKHGGARPNSGRPKGVVSAKTRAIQEMALEHADDMFAILLDLAQNASADNVRKDCAMAILERAYGKPKQGLELSGPDGGPIEVKRHEQALASLA